MDHLLDIIIPMEENYFILNRHINTSLENIYKLQQ